VNLLLIDPHELAADGTFVVDDRRAAHLREVIGAELGQVVRAGIVGGGLGTATLLSDDGTRMSLRLALVSAVPGSLPIELVLAIPRPKVLTRVIETAAAFGVARVELTNAWRVDKSYLKSPRLAAPALAMAARIGAEQGATTHVTPVAVHDRLMTLLDARWPAPAAGAALDRQPPPSLKLIAHPAAPPIETVATRAALADAPAVLAIGPEGGWIDRELATFVDRGFAPVSMGAPILRVEAAVAAALAQLLLLRRAPR
jgi:RsmE family RNA methyltransferase